MCVCAEEVEVEKTTCTDQRKEEEEQIRKEEEPEQSNDGEAQKISAESGISDSGSNPIGKLDFSFYFSTFFYIVGATIMKRNDLCA